MRIEIDLLFFTILRKIWQNSRFRVLEGNFHFFCHFYGKKRQFSHFCPHNLPTYVTIIIITVMILNNIKLYLFFFKNTLILLPHNYLFA